MTLARPIPDAEEPAQQRLELELLLQQTVPGPKQLSCSWQLLQDGSTGLDADQWRALRALPIAIDDDHLDIAVPSHWDEQDRSESWLSILATVGRSACITRWKAI